MTKKPDKHRASKKQDASKEGPEVTLDESETAEESRDAQDESPSVEQREKPAADVVAGSDDEQQQEGAELVEVPTVELEQLKAEKDEYYDRILRLTAEFENYKTLYRDAYYLVKAISPETQVGLSYLYKLFLWDQELALPSELGPHDFIAFATYPGWMVRRGIVDSPFDIDSNWYGQIRQVFPNIPIIISEIGWASEGSGSRAQQADFIGELPRLMRDLRPHLVTWTLLHDVTFFHPNLLSLEAVEFLDSLGVDYELLFQDFNSMGIHERDGTPKPSWLQAYQLDFGQ